MTLLLQIESGQGSDAPAPMQMTLEQDAKLIIGRGAQANWVLADANKHISAVHCLVEGKGDDFFLTDKSTNGTFVNGDSKRIDGPHKLASGDTLKIGPFQIRVSLIGIARSPAAAHQNQSPEKIEVSPQVHRRGGDPGAIAASVNDTPPIKEKVVSDNAASMTVIRPFVKAPPQPTEPAAPPLAAVAPNRSETPAPNSAADDNAILHSLERGLGEKMAAVDFPDPLSAVQQLARTVKALTEQIESMAAKRNEMMRALGSRREYLVGPSALGAGKLAEALHQAMRQTADPAPLIAEAMAEMARHDQRLVEAIRTGTAKMAQVIAPPSNDLKDDSAASRWLQNYRTLWQGLGPDWPSSFAAALLMQMIFAYDAGVDK